MPIPVPAANDTSSAEILNTSGYLADGKPQHLTWTNDTGHDLRVVIAEIWNGADADSVADIWAAASRESDGSVLVVQAFDRYANPSQPCLTTKYLSTGMVVKAGDKITLDAVASQLAVPQTSHSAHALTIWYTLA